eukprot:g72.t1
MVARHWLQRLLALTCMIHVITALEPNQLENSTPGSSTCIANTDSNEQIFCSPTPEPEPSITLAPPKHLHHVEPSVSPIPRAKARRRRVNRSVNTLECSGRACSCGDPVARIKNTNLWIGDLRSAHNASLLRIQNISRVVSVLFQHEEEEGGANADHLFTVHLAEALEMVKNEDGHPRPASSHTQHFIRHRIAVLDDGSHRLAPHLSTLKSALECTEHDGVPCSALVHCVEGVSRSPTFIMAYLIIVRGWTLKEALDALRAARPCIQPRFQWFEELLELERNITGGFNSVSHADNYVPLALAPLPSPSL